MAVARVAAGVLSLGLMAVGAGTISAQEFPTRPVRIVTSPPGGSNDFAARIIVPGLSAGLGQPVVIDNRPTLVTAGVVAKSAADGYTLLVTGGSFMFGHLLQTLTYDPVKDFTPVSMVNLQPNIVVVHPSLPVKSVRELIALAKSRSGELNYASGAIASMNHLSAELFKSMAGVNIVHIPYKGAGPALSAMLGGEVLLMIVNPSSVTPHIKSGRLRALAVTSSQPSPLVPGLPTVAASGVPGYEAVLVTAVFAPAGTPAAVISRLNQEMVRAISRPEVKTQFLSAGTEPASSSPAELAAVMNAEMAKYGKIIREAGIRVE
jgi:tripartite-type tricarboxylate transporter receptor subunit TctC